MSQFLASGERLKRLRYLNEQIERLKDADYVFLEQHFEKLYANWDGRKHAHPELLRFEDALINEAASQRVPLYVAARATSEIRVFHAQWEDRLDDLDWRYISSIAFDAARKSGIKIIEWGGWFHSGGHAVVGEFVGPDPSRWEIDCQDGCSDLV